MVPDRDLSANSMFFRWKPISISCTTTGTGGTGEDLCFFCLGGRMYCTVTGVVSSLELLSSSSGDEGCVASTARYWHTARAAACGQTGQFHLGSERGQPRSNTPSHLQLLLVEDGFDGGRLRGGRQQLLQQDEGGLRPLRGQVPCIQGRRRPLVR